MRLDLNSLNKFCEQELCSYLGKINNRGVNCSTFPATVANINSSRPGRSRKALEAAGFRWLNPNKSLKEQGFYEGFPCHLGHTIRDVQQHWCYHCAVKIRANICGLNINLTHEYHRSAISEVIQSISDETLGDPNACWIPKKQINPLSYPTWRSGASGRLNAVQPKKIIYQAFWGDIGQLYATTAKHICKNIKCMNPLHMTSGLHSADHRRPKDFQYLQLEWHNESLAVMALRKRHGLTIDDLHKKAYKPTIRDPKIEGHMQTRQDIGNDKPERISTREITTESP